MNRDLWEMVLVGSSVAISTGLSVGYVIWLVRGGVLLSTLFSTLPAWRIIDPLPILIYANKRSRQTTDDDEDSLESMVNHPGIVGGSNFRVEESHDEQDNEQIFTGGSRACDPDGARA